MRKTCLALTIAALVGLAGCSVEGLPGLAEEGEEPRPEVSFSQSDAGQIHSSAADVIEETLDSVVNVRVTSIDPGAFGVGGTVRGQGSGVVIDEDGVIVTNNHVVAGAVEVTVAFNDGRDALVGTVVGTAPDRDLAVIQVEADDLTPIELGRSASMRLGDEVIAIGFPLGLGGPTVTKGIISATERTIRPSGGPEDAGSSVDPFELEGLLQTDAAINPGNSGGALIDLSGRLVGINTAAAQAGSAENIGFAIPIDRALPIVEEILSEPPEEQGAWLGVSIVTVDPSVAGQLGLDADTTGAAIAAIFPGSPAESEGLEEGDVIVEVHADDEDFPIESSQDFVDTLTGFDPGDVVEIEVLREGESLSFEVELAARPRTISSPSED